MDGEDVDDDEAEDADEMSFSPLEDTGEPRGTTDLRQVTDSDKQ